jgi:hypothetical protein
MRAPSARTRIAAGRYRKRKKEKKKAQGFWSRDRGIGSF